MAQTKDFLPVEQAFVLEAQIPPTSATQQANKEGLFENHILVQFDIAPNYYMYQEAFDFKITSLDPSLKLASSPILPVGISKFDENFNKELVVYHDQVQIKLPILSQQKELPRFKLSVTSRGCAEKGLCYPPQNQQLMLGAGQFQDTTAALASIEDVRQFSKQQDEQFFGASQPFLHAKDKWLLTLSSLFFLGLFLSFTPCMLPLYPVLSVILANKTSQQANNPITKPRQGRSMVASVTYVFGMALAYSLLGIWVSLGGAGIQEYLQNPITIGFVALIIFVLALTMFDWFQLPAMERWTKWLHTWGQKNHGLTSIFLMGMASALIMSPCITAPMVGVLTYMAQSGDLFLGGLGLFVLALGMGLPLILLGAGLERYLPKQGAWMVHIKHFLGVVMMVGAIWIAQPLWFNSFKQITGNHVDSSWITVTSPQEFEQLRAISNQPIVLDIYADWCRSCIEMEQETFADERVQTLLKRTRNIRLDMTRFDHDDAQFLRKMSLYGPPAVLFFEQGVEKPRNKIVGFTTAPDFIKSFSGWQGTINQEQPLATPDRPAAP